MYVCMHICPKGQLDESIRSEKEVRKTGNPVNNRNPILKTNMQLYVFQIDCQYLLKSKKQKVPVMLIQILDANQVDTSKTQQAASSDQHR